MINKQNENITFSPSNPYIIIDKPEAHHDDKVWLSYENTREAQWRLTPEAFCLYMYFALLNDKQTDHFKSADFCEDFNLSEDAYMDAYNELLDNDYLVPAMNKEAILHFHDYPLVFPYLTSSDNEFEISEEA